MAALRPATIDRSPLLTDLYQLAMIEAYLAADHTRTACFEFFVRKLPATRRFLIAAGLAQVVDWLRELRFMSDEIDWLASESIVSPRTLDYLADLRFTGDVDAMPEGRAFFTDEPILRVVAPLPVAQLVETRIVNLLHSQSLIATKAATGADPVRARRRVAAVQPGAPIAWRTVLSVRICGSTTGSRPGR